MAINNAAGKVVRRPDFLASAVCARAIRDAETLERALGITADDTDQHVINCSALALTGRAIDAAGRQQAGDAPADRLKILLHRLRMAIPGAVLTTAPPLFPDLSLLCRTRPDGIMRRHTDHGWRVLSAVVYLNDNFSGGTTRFDGGPEIIPKTGTLIAFPGSELPHEVTRVEGGPRYTLSFWWSLDPMRLEA